MCDCCGDNEFTTSIREQLRESIAHVVKGRVVAFFKESTGSALIEDLLLSIDLKDQVESCINQNLNSLISDITIRSIKELTIQATLAVIKERGLMGKIQETAREIVDCYFEANPIDSPLPILSEEDIASNEKTPD
jgi:hypothetical protein